MPRVFISYARESAGLMAEVLSLAQRLRADGVDCRIDQFINGHPEEGWLVWMEREIAVADNILVVCSETYLRRFNGEDGPGNGLGVTWEAQLTKTALYAGQGANLKVIPVYFSRDARAFIPSIIRFHTTSYFLTEQYEELLRFLTRQPRIVPVTLGSIPRLEVDTSALETVPDNDEFTASIKEHMATLDRTVEKLTRDQFRVINQLRLLKRVRVSGMPGSGKTLVAAEKALRVGRAGLRTLFLCHNPLLADYVAKLTCGSDVLVAAFNEWVSALSATPSEDHQQWSRYHEPTDDELGRAFDGIASFEICYDAIIVDEGQDFREGWWALLDAALTQAPHGVLYIFHDDRQALLPYRARYPFEQPVIDLSRNCRNGGRIYEVMRCLEAGAPECEPELRHLGRLSLEIARSGCERDAVRRALAWFPSTEMKGVAVVFCGSAAFAESIFDDLVIPIDADIGWQDEVRRMFAQACTARREVSISGGIQTINAQLDRLSSDSRPSPADVQLVCRLARQFTMPPDHRRAVLNSANHREGLAWQVNQNSVRLKRKRGSAAIWASDIVMHFERENWHEGLPDYQSFGFSRNLGITEKASLPVYHVSEFKGLESNSVLLYVHNLGSMPAEEFLVGVSRARLFLSIVIDSQAEHTLPQSVRRFLWEANR